MIYAGYRSSRFNFDPRRKTIWSAVAAYLQRYIPEDGAVLDLGSGYCDFINAVHARRRWALDAAHYALVQLPRVAGSVVATVRRGRP